MALDGIFLSFLTSEVSQTLVGAKVDKIHQPGKNELVFIFRTRTGLYKLFLTADANAPRFNLAETTPENPQNPPMLCMLFRKKLAGATLADVRQQGLDRIVFFEFDATDDIGDPCKLTLAVEIMAQHSNIILFGEDGRIVDAVKRVDAEKSSYRLVLPGAVYKLPPEQIKLDIRSAGIGNIVDSVCACAGSKLSSAVLKTVQGVSPLTAREIAYRTCFEDKAAADLQPMEKERLAAAFELIKNMLETGTASFTIMLDEADKPAEFSFLPITQYGTAVRNIAKNTPSQLLEGFYSERDRLNRTRSRASELFKQLDNLIERTSRKLNNQREDLNRCADRDTLRIRAELITANQYKLQKGADVYTVENYYENNQPVDIPADPALSPSQNAQKLYKEYRKACTAEQMLKTLIESSVSDLAYLESVKDMLTRSTIEREFSEIKDELITQGFIKPKKNGKKQMKKAALPPLEFKTSQGLTVLVGRNNMQNDKLTFKTAKKGDIWLHAQKTTGSHTILISNGGEVPDDAIVEAAQIAAFYSSAKESTVVTVDYSDVKNIKKPNGAKPGFVIYYTYYSVNVKPKDPLA